MEPSDSVMPLSGIKVIEVGVAMAGPFCGTTLADYGADVIKVERPGSGDESRGWQPYFPGRVSYYFAAANRNKRSLAIDLKQQKGAEVLRRLIADADVIIDNYRVGALDKRYPRSIPVSFIAASAVSDPPGRVRTTAPMTSSCKPFPAT
jgi:crotonobetainyl-CoA:carnitine CoA-transferase CaiB-like acyl-CoA transferase